MKTIIAGGRNITDYSVVERAIKDSGFTITEVVTGRCRGVDWCGEDYAEANGIPVKPFPAEWNRYGTMAGPIRNRQMAEYGEALILVWNGKSRGSANMLEEATKRGLKIYQHIVE